MHDFCNVRILSSILSSGNILQYTFFIIINNIFNNFDKLIGIYETTRVYFINID